MRKSKQAMELVWRGSQSWGSSADIFVHNNYDGNYNPPPGFMFEWGSWDPAIVVRPPLLATHRDLSSTWWRHHVTCPEPASNNL
jgi:hypothetical protein